MKNTETTKKSFTEIEEIIENRIDEESEIWELDRWDINEIRLETYKANGWSYDPFPEEDEEEDGEDYKPTWHSMTMSQRLAEVGMSERDFF